VRRKNRTRSAADNRNWLIDEFQRIVVELLPAAVFLENVPGIENYHRFKSFLQTLTGRSNRRYTIWSRRQSSGIGWFSNGTFAELGEPGRTAQEYRQE